MNPTRRSLRVRRRRPAARNHARLCCQALEDRTVPASFQGLGYLSGGSSYSFASAVSTDGSVVVGSASGAPGYGRVTRWTAGTGIVDLGTLTGTTSGEARGVSADGSVVVGYCRGNHDHAFLWRAAAGMVDLGALAGASDAHATGVSADGSVVVGWCDTNGLNYRAFRWTAATGMVDLGILPGGSDPAPTAVSADGSVIVGGYSGSTGNRAFRWTAATGMVDLGTLSGGSWAGAESVSADGSVVCGVAQQPAGSRGVFRWTAATGMVDLGTLPGATDVNGGYVSGDGSVVVGDYWGSTGIEHTFRWTASGGMRDLQSDLVNVYGQGSQLAGWNLLEAGCISPDGRTMAGDGTAPQPVQQAWIARLDAPPTVASIKVNDGSAQRSEVRSITVTFSGPVTFAGGDANAAAAFQLNHVQTGGNVILSAAVATDPQGRTVVTLGFSGAETDPVSAGNGGTPSLADGRYTLTVFGASVTGPGGAALAGGGPNGNYVSPADTFGGAGLHLYRLFGDVNGDGVVDTTDLGQLRATFNANQAQPNYLWFLDADNSGAVDFQDLSQFRSRFNVNVF